MEIIASFPREGRFLSFQQKGVNGIIVRGARFKDPDRLLAWVLPLVRSSVVESI